MARQERSVIGAYYSGRFHGPRIPSGDICCCILIQVLIRLIVATATASVIFGFFYWLIVQPHFVKFHVTDSNLSQFNFTANNTLQYNLALNITIRNPNKNIGIYYDSIQARAFYKDHGLSSVFLTPFYQGHKNTTVLNPVFRGQQLVLLSSDESTEFNEDKTSGVYDIYLKLYLTIRYKNKFYRVEKDTIKPKIRCHLKVPLNSGDGRLAGVPETTKCKPSL